MFCCFDNTFSLLLLLLLLVVEVIEVVEVVEVGLIKKLFFLITIIADSGIGLPTSSNIDVLPLPRLALLIFLLYPIELESKLKSFGLTLPCNIENNDFG
jgi:hypothetical protein